jgi:hypothetical protein
MNANEDKKETKWMNNFHKVLENINFIIDELDQESYHLSAYQSTLLYYAAKVPGGTQSRSWGLV